MDKLEKVIQALENCTDPEMNDDDDDEIIADCIRAGACPWDDCQERGRKLIDVPLSLAMAALELLKAQEARVMTLEEIKAWACKTGSQKDAVYIQNFNDPEFMWAYIGKFESDSGISRFDGYGYSWRCWTARPTDEQRKEVKWDE